MSDNNTFGGFSALGSMLSNPDITNNIPSEDDFNDDGGITEIDDIKDPSEMDIDNEPKEDDFEEIPPKDSVETSPIDTKDPIEDPDENEDEDGELSTEDEDGDNTDDLSLGEAEPEIAQYLQERLFNSYGWEVGEDEQFNSVEDLVKFIDSTIEQNSTPRYANNQIKELNDYVSNGGNLKSYFESVYGSNTSNINIETKAGQDKALREFFKLQGISDNIIDSKIQRYEDTGVLKDEAIEANEYLENYKTYNSNKLLEEQKKIKEANDKAQQEFVSSVEQSIQNLKNVRGIPVSASERQELLDYIFKPTETGKTQYQTEYESSINNLIESAFFTKKGDALVKKLNAQASSNAAKALKNKLQTKTKIKGGSGSPTFNESRGVSFSSLGRAIGRPSFTN